MRAGVRLTVTAGLVLLAVGLAGGQAPKPQAAKPLPKRPMKVYANRFYEIHSDLDDDDVRMAQMRTTAMAREYLQQTRSFATGRAPTRMPLYLFSRAEDYYAAGGPPGSGGCFTGNKLLAIIGPQATEQSWQVVQHEGFHQFAEQIISRKIPVWIEEGLADYFGNGIFTGDGFVTGIVFPHQRQMVQSLIKSENRRSIEDLMKVNSVQWASELDFTNYLQAWSIVYFLLHGEDGKYRKGFDQFLAALSRGTGWKPAWKAQFGTDVDALEQRWRQWWLALPDNATWDLHARAMVATATSYFARAVSQKQQFADADDFFRQARAGTLKSDPADWLGPRMIAERLYPIMWYGKYQIVQPPASQPQLHCTLRGGGKMIGTFRLSPAGRVESVSVEVQRPSGPAAATKQSAPPASMPDDQPSAPLPVKPD